MLKHDILITSGASLSKYKDSTSFLGSTIYSLLSSSVVVQIISRIPPSVVTLTASYDILDILSAAGVIAKIVS